MIAAGLFAIGKGKEFEAADGRWLEILRLIINMVGSNEVMEDFDGDTATLPYLGQWRAMALDKGDLWVWTGEDVRAAFYLLVLPKIWGNYMLIDLLLPGWWFGHGDEEIMLCLNVIPMGWKLAVAIAQHVMRQLVRNTSKIPRELELRRDKPLPCQEDFSTRRFWQVFIGDVAKGSRKRKQEQEDSHGWLLKVRKTGQPLAFVFDDGEKRQAEAVGGESLGSRIDGTELEVTPRPLRCAEAVALASHVMSEDPPKTKHCEIVGGLVSFLVQYTPPMMACVGELWGEIILERREVEKRCEAMAEDFPPLFALLPLCAIKLAKDVDHRASCSDPSKTRETG